MIIRMNQNIEILEKTVQLLDSLADEAEREKKTVVHLPRSSYDGTGAYPVKSKSIPPGLAP